MDGGEKRKEATRGREFDRFLSYSWGVNIYVVWGRASLQRAKYDFLMKISGEHLPKHTFLY